MTGSLGGSKSISRQQPGARLRVCMAGCVWCLCAGWIPRRVTGVPKTSLPTSRIKVLLLPSCFLENHPGCTALSPWIWHSQLSASLWSLSGTGCPFLLAADPRRGDTHQCPSLGCLTRGDCVLPIPLLPRYPASSPAAAASCNLPLLATSAPAAWQRGWAGSHSDPRAGPPSSQEVLCQGGVL